MNRKAKITKGVQSITVLQKKTDDYEERRKIVCHDVDKSNDGIYLFKFLPDITIVFSLQMFRL